MSSEIQALYEKFHNNTVFVLGGGPSVSTVDLARLRGKNVLCLNSAYKYLDSCSAILWCDSTWASKNDQELRERTAIKIGCLSGVRQIGRDYSRKTIGDSTVLSKTGSSGYDPNIMNVRGNNSGTMAINLLMNMGVKTVILIGFDMTSSNSKSHFHSDYDFVVSKSVYQDTFVPNFIALMESAKQYNINTTVLNASPNSALTIFKKIQLNDYI